MQKVTTEKKTTISTKMVIAVVMIAAFVVGMGFIGVLSGFLPLTKTVVTTVEPLPDVEPEPEPFIIPERVIIDNRFLTAFIFDEEDGAAEIALTDDIKNRGGRVYLILPGGVMIARLDDIKLPNLRKSFSDVATITGHEAQNKEIFGGYPEDTQDSLRSFSNLAYHEEQYNKDGTVELIVPVDSTTVGTDVINEEEGIFSIIEAITNDDDLTKEQKQKEIESLQQSISTKSDSIDLELTGKILTEIIYVESAASGSPGDEDWTPEQWLEHTDTVINGLYALASAAPDSANLLFKLIISVGPEHPANIVSYEPSSGVHEMYWIHQLMQNRGINISLAQYRNEVLLWSDILLDLYDFFDVEQAYVFFVVKDQYNAASSPEGGGIWFWPHAWPGNFAVTNWSHGIKHNDFFYPSSIVPDNVNNKVYIADTGNHRVARFDSGDGGTVYGENLEYFGTFGNGTNNFNLPRGIFVDSGAGKVYVADTSNSRIIRFDTNPFGANFESFGSIGSGNDQFDGPYSITVDSTYGQVYVADLNNSRIVRIDSGAGATSFGDNWETFGTNGSGTNQFNGPRDVSVDTLNGQVYVADLNNSRIVRIDSGAGATSFGDNWETFGTNGSGTNQFNGPTSVSYDSSSSMVYVVDSTNHRIVRFDIAPFGSGWESFGGYGYGEANFLFPSKISVDSINSKVYVTDSAINLRLIRFGTDPLGSNWDNFNSYDRSFMIAGGTVAHEVAHVFYASDQYMSADVGCIANILIGHNRVIAAGEDSSHTNRNDYNCDDYQNSLMKSTFARWLEYYFSSPNCLTCPTPYIDWHARAQLGWGDTDILAAKIFRPNPSSVWEEKLVNVYLDNTWVGEYQLYAGFGYLYIPITEGLHKLELYSDDGTYGLFGLREKYITIENTIGPNGVVTTNGITPVEVNVDFICHDGIIPYECPGDLVCKMSSGDCVGCLIDSDCSGGNVCNTETNLCVTCVTDGECTDSDICTIDECNNPGTLNSSCTYNPRPNTCGDRECGTDDFGCYECGTCSTDFVCLSGYCEEICSDGTLPGQCNAINYICQDGNLVQTDCRDCGCPIYTGCQLDDVSGAFICKCNVDCNKFPDNPCCPRPAVQ